MKFYFWCFSIFMSGWVAALNISKLISVNPEWTGSWVKLFFSIILGCCFTYAAKSDL